MSKNNCNKTHWYCDARNNCSNKRSCLKITVKQRVKLISSTLEKKTMALVLLMALSMSPCHSVAVSNWATNNIHEYQPCPLLESHLQTVISLGYSKSNITSIQAVAHACARKKIKPLPTYPTCQFLCQLILFCE